MEPWVWLVVYLAGFTLLQLVLYRYFSRDVPRSETTTPASVENPTPRVHDRGEPPDGDVRPCPHCGADNESDSAYSFCRECLSPLG